MAEDNKIIEFNNNTELKKEAITAAMRNIEYIPSFPVAEDEKKDLTLYTKLPLAKLAAVGTGFESIVPAISNAMAQAGKGGEILYRATLKPGTHLAALKDGSGYISTMIQDGEGIVGQAPLNPVMFNPTALFMAAALAGIEKKMDAIQETQKEMFNFIKQQEEARLEAGLSALANILNSYKYNWNNKEFTGAYYNQILGIKKEADASIRLYIKQISDKRNKNKLLYSDVDIEKKLNALKSDFKNYKSALYVYSFASFMEVMTLENFNSGFLNSITSKLDEYESEFLKLYLDCYKEIKDISGKSLEQFALKGATAVVKGIGKVVAKSPVGDKTNIDEKLAITGSKMESFGKNRQNKSLMKMIEDQLEDVKPFSNSINTINKIYNEPLNIMFDKDNIYLQLPA